uniref:Uncharacterized protein n=1 Tax=Russula lepida TaxID=152963 RepID=A0A2S0U3Y1_9AGAM|nr:hypothetical protein [Russula lepida]AWB36203.1 hypothetical protein [Russula lepida]
MKRFQNYSHYKLPITMNPLEYGKLIIKIDELNLFIVQINKTNIALIQQYDELNHIKFFKEGDLIFEYKDHKSADNTFIRSLNNKKFTFRDNELTLVTTDLSVQLNKLIQQSKLIFDFKSILNLNSTTILKNKIELI